MGCAHQTKSKGTEKESRVGWALPTRGKRFRRERSGLRATEKRYRKARSGPKGRILTNFLLEKRKFDKENQCQRPGGPLGRAKRNPVRMAVVVLPTY